MKIDHKFSILIVQLEKDEWSYSIMKGSKTSYRPKKGMFWESARKCCENALQILEENT